VTTITIAAVGDLLMKAPIIASARLDGNGQYNFDPIFEAVKPQLQNANLLIGNLETTFSGKPRKSGKYETRAPRTGYPAFNCPDELAGTLKRLGFDVLTTANNHCMDGGTSGLKRTLKVLDRQGLKHTGTARSAREARRYMMLDVKGIKVGILSYTTGTNSIPFPRAYLVNKIRLGRIAADIKAMKRRADFVIVCLHFGLEYHRSPNARQKGIVNAVFKYGADAILGAHPHVLQPVKVSRVKDGKGRVKKRVVAYSLGNFISTRLHKNVHTQRGLILKLTVQKDRRGRTSLIGVSKVHTKVNSSGEIGNRTYRVVPM
jgi:poly-gamma-glutamate capsule biosynthesis protein CapA/YwtB (metallophosphatase superfamily)